MNGVEYLLGTENIDNTPLRAYDAQSCAFLAALSERITKDGLSRRFPDLAALAFWCRKGNVRKKAEACPEAAFRLGRGLCFHVTPGNIPVNFAFSYFFALLAGNASIVRLPSREYPQTAPLCAAIAATLADFPDIAARTAFVRYKADNDITAAFSARADARLIWGGDHTIATVKAMPAAPRCVDVAFADRYSLCILNAQAVLAAEDGRLARLAEDFYNDTYLMDQNACSSPQIILWYEDDPAARSRFWDAVFDLCKRRYALQAAVAVDKYTQLCADAAQLVQLQAASRRENLLYRAALNAPFPGMEALRGKGGYFYEAPLTALAQLAPAVTEKYQTLTHFGMDAEALRTFVLENRLRGIDRIAPVGKALEVDVLWDGYDLVRMLSRLVNAEG